MSGTSILPPLFERLASGEGEREGYPAQTFDREALVDSVHTELLRLLNTRRASRPITTPPTILDYGIADWTAFQGQRSDDRHRLAREIRSAVQHFEPRLQLGEVEVIPLPGQPHRLNIRLSGTLRNGKQHWPVAFVIEQAGDGLEVRHERFD